MSALVDLQRALQDHVLERDDGTRARSAVITNAAADSDQRLGVYRFAYAARLIEVLGNDYPALAAIAGAETFEALCRAYVVAHPSPHFNVRWYGEGLPTFARDTAPWSTQPWLGETADLEWQMGLAFDAAADAVVTVDDVAGVAPERWPGMSLRLHASLRCLEPAWNVAALRRAFDRATAIAAPARCETRAPIAVWRKHATVRYRELEADEFAGLAAARNGATFAELCEVLCEWHAPEAVAARTANFFRLWVEDHWVSELVFADTDASDETGAAQADIASRSSR